MGIDREDQLKHRELDRQTRIQRIKGEAERRKEMRIHVKQQNEQRYRASILPWSQREIAEGLGVSCQREEIRRLSTTGERLRVSQLLIVLCSKPNNWPRQRTILGTDSSDNYAYLIELLSTSNRNKKDLTFIYKRRKKLFLPLARRFCWLFLHETSIVYVNKLSDFSDALTNWQWDRLLAAQFSPNNDESHLKQWTLTRQLSMFVL